MPEHIHLLIRDPQKKNPSTVMQALKLSFARRVLAQARDEDATPGRVRAESQTAGCPASHPSANAQGKLSQKAREVAHPQLFRVNTQRQPALILSTLTWPTRPGLPKPLKGQLISRSIRHR